MHFDISDQRVTARVMEELAQLPMDVQRDWRRRGILPPLEGGRASYTTFEVCRIEAMRVLATRGVTLKATGLVANTLAQSVRSRLVRVKPALVEFRGTPLPHDQRLQVIDELFPLFSRFAVIVPADDPGAEIQINAETADLDGLSAALDHGAPSAVVLDLQAIAARIADRATFPLVIVTEVKE